MVLKKCSFEPNCELDCALWFNATAAEVACSPSCWYVYVCDNKKTARRKKDCNMHDTIIHEENPATSGNIITINEQEVRGYLNTVVKETIEETLNGLLDAEADDLCNAAKYERSPERESTRAGHYTRSLHVAAGKLKLRVPRLRNVPFESAIIERYRRREASVEEALIEMYIAGVSVRRVEDVTQALWGTRVSPQTVSNLNKKIYGRIDEWRIRKLENSYSYVYLDGIWLKRSWGGEVKNVSVLVALGVNSEGYREIIGIEEGAKEDKTSWSKFLRGLKERGLKGVKLVVSDKSIGLVESIPDFYPEAMWQRCAVHFYRDVMGAVPKHKIAEVMRLVKTLHTQESADSARKKAAQVVETLKAMKLHQAAKIVADGAEETFSYYAFPPQHWLHIRTNNLLERLNKEIRRRTRVIGSFPDAESAIMLISARLRHMMTGKWGEVRYMNMDLLRGREAVEETIVA